MTGTDWSRVQAFGPEGWGIIRVASVPQVAELRMRLLPLAQQFAVRRLGSVPYHLETCRVPGQICGSPCAHAEALPSHDRRSRSHALMGAGGELWFQQMEQL